MIIEKTAPSPGRKIKAYMFSQITGITFRVEWKLQWFSYSDLFPGSLPNWVSFLTFLITWPFSSAYLYLSICHLVTLGLYRSLAQDSKMSWKAGVRSYLSLHPCKDGIPVKSLLRWGSGEEMKAWINKFGSSDWVYYSLHTPQHVFSSFLEDIPFNSVILKVWILRLYCVLSK